MNQNETVLEFRNVTKEYRLGGTLFYGLKSVSLSIRRGEFTALVGPSGSGKSTLQHLGAGFDRASGGEVLLMGKDIAQYSEKELSYVRNRCVGFVFQSFNLIPVLTVLENVMYPAEVYGKPYPFEGSAKERALYLLERAGLLQQAKKRPHQLSGGQRQRVAIARALMNSPALVFADEPTANLDHATGNSIFGLLTDLNREFGTTVLFSTHDAQVMSFARRTISLRDGELCGDSHA
ncbi:MAG: ABC transporter ATP-binding protein [Treponema sp.]|nr:ABC transporter ATP-binding protein [Treponema sp.]